MGLFNRLKKTKPKSEVKSEKKSEVKKASETKSVKPKSEVKPKATVSAVKEKSAPAKSQATKSVTKGKTQRADRVLIRPLVTEKSSDLGSLGKYVFMIDPRMNKIEVKKAIRKIYNVDPVQVNISNISGKRTRYGRITGRTKNWKKAIVTLRPGDKIEIYEGV